MGNFALDLKAWADKAQSNTDTLVREVVIELGTRIVERSPVGNPDLWQSPPPPGYSGGRFRANWQHGFNDRPQGEIDAIDASGQTSINAITQGAMASPAAGMHYIANNLPYAVPLEEGHSTQAPHGMVALAIVDLGGIVASEAAKLK